LSDDAELMRRAKEGDEAAFAALMGRWELPVKRLLARILMNASDAEDLAQETFVRVWQSRSRFRSGAEFRPWLFSIAVNLARNRLRWWRRRPEVELRDWDEAGAGPGMEGPDALERKERSEAVRSAIARLPLDQREALVLFCYEGLSHQEIAEVLGGTPKSVEAKLYRARAGLKAPLARWTKG
jgi:RNA polymerase sigma-70 factor (ECF subfamily)